MVFNTNCPICDILIVPGEGVAYLKCGHQHCLCCFAQLSRTSTRCSVCRCPFVDIEPDKQKHLTEYDFFSVTGSVIEHMGTSGDLSVMRNKMINDLKKVITTEILQLNLPVTRNTERVTQILISNIEKFNIVDALWTVGLRVAESCAFWYEQENAASISDIIAEDDYPLNEENLSSQRV